MYNFLCLHLALSREICIHLGITCCVTMVSVLPKKKCFERPHRHVATGTGHKILVLRNITSASERKKQRISNPLNNEETTDSKA